MSYRINMENSMTKFSEVVKYLNERYKMNLVMGPTGGDATNGKVTIVNMGDFIMHVESGRRSSRRNSRGVIADQLGLSS